MLLAMKVCIFVLYCWVGRMTRVFPLSAVVMVASFSRSFVFMECKVLCSDWWVRVVCGVVTSVWLGGLILVF